MESYSLVTSSGSLINLDKYRGFDKIREVTDQDFLKPDEGMRDVQVKSGYRFAFGKKVVLTAEMLLMCAMGGYVAHHKSPEYRIDKVLTSSIDNNLNDIGLLETILVKKMEDIQPNYSVVDALNFANNFDLPVQFDL